MIPRGESREAFDVRMFWGFLFPSGYRGNRSVVILKAYCDESGPHPGTPRVLTVAGALSTDAGWEHFEPRWKAVLDEHGIDCFHMVDFENRDGHPYDEEHWERYCRIPCIKSLIDTACLTRPRILGAACAVVLDEYEALTREERRKLGEPYFFCSQWLIRQFGYFMNINKAKGMIAYVFEKRRGVGPVMEAFNEASETVGDERRLDSIAAAPKATFVPLQLADLLAYEHSKEALRQIGAPGRKEIRQSLARLADGMHLRGYIFDGPTLRATLEAGIKSLAESDLDVVARKKGVFQDRPE